MEEINEVDKLEEVVLPGFRFHPTDEELVGFYLKRKIQQRSFSIELIRQLDIYKYDPWDLPKLAITGEKEWYFYCPRDRKYRNSARPNRVTGAGFWKATGTDRPIYSSEGSTKCIGLKKSLVFYKGKAAKGVKTDWMMHEFRLPSLTDSSTTTPPKRFFMEKSFPPNDLWAICRIFKKTSSQAQRTGSHSIVPPLSETSTSNLLSKNAQNYQQMFSTKPTSQIAFSSDLCEIQQPSTTSSTNPFDYISYKAFNQMANHTCSHQPFSSETITTSYMFSPLEPSELEKYSIDVSSILLNMSSSVVGDFGGKPSEKIKFGLQEHCPQAIPNEMEGQYPNVNVMNNGDDQEGVIGSFGNPFNLPLNVEDGWRSNFLWDPSSCSDENYSYL